MQGPREAARIISSVRGRMRLHVPALQIAAAHDIEETLTAVRGVREVRASALTGNVLVRFDPVALTATEVSLLVTGVSRDLPIPIPKPMSKPPLRLPPLPDLIAVIVALATAESPIGLLLAGVDALKLIDALVA